MKTILNLLKLILLIIVAICAGIITVVVDTSMIAVPLVIAFIVCASTLNIIARIF